MISALKSFRLVLLVGLVLLVVAGNAHAAGFQFQTVPDPDDRPIQTAIWYPSRDPPTRLPNLDMSVALNGAATGEALPLVIISHGNGGTLIGHRDTAIALADAGFVVAAPMHTGDNFQDQSRLGAERWFTDRPRHIRQVIDYMLGDWTEYARIDPRRVGFFGFSMGGFTGLVVIGGTPDFARLRLFCANQPADFVCSFLRQAGSEVLNNSPRLPVWLSDERVKAAVLAAPGLPIVFRPESIGRVNVPVQLWSAPADDRVPSLQVAELRRLLPAPVEYHSVPGAGHFAFLPPCAISAELCTDPPGFDRAAFHVEFNASVVEFFRTRLPPR